MTKDFFIKNLWLRSTGREEKQEPEPVCLDDLIKTEWSPEFEQLMRNRLIMGALRYGKLHEPGKSQYERTKSILRRIYRYRVTGNKELLVDVANFCLLEFEECDHPNAHFHAVDDGEHVDKIKGR